MICLKSEDLTVTTQSNNPLKNYFFQIGEYICEHDLYCFSESRDFTLMTISVNVEVISHVSDPYKLSDIHIC